MSGWVVTCGCDTHGDHLGCDFSCKSYTGSCAQPLGTEIVVATEAEAEALVSVEPYERLERVPPQPVWVDIRVLVRPAVGAEFGLNNSLADFMMAADDADVAAKIERRLGNRDLDGSWEIVMCRGHEEFQQMLDED